MVIGTLCIDQNNQEGEKEHMMLVLNFMIVHWLAITAFMSVFWGLRGAYLDYRARTEAYILTKSEDPPLRAKAEFLFVWSSYQFIFNFTGSLVGWCCFYILVTRMQPGLLRNLDLSDFFLLVFSFLGITGLLPQSFYGVVGSLERLAEVVTGRLLK